MTKLVVKRLTASDLTFFEWQFRNKPAGNQKAINLNSDILVGRLYPALPEVAAAVDGRFAIDLSVMGPGEKSELSLARKVLKQEKNWRLDGETIHNPASDPDRFNILSAGDIAVMEFNDGAFPTQVRIVFVAQGVAEDRPVHAALASLLAGSSMVLSNQHALSEAIALARPSDTHPINHLLVDADLEDAAQGGVEGLTRLRRRGSGRKVLRSELLKAKRQGEENGQRGEELVNHRLQALHEAGEIGEYTWDSADNAVAPYDFVVRELDGQSVKLDVKATTGEFDRAIHLSIAELEEIVASDRYELHRVYAMTSATARMRIARNLKPLAAAILEGLRALPRGVTADGVSIQVDALHFEEEMTLYLPEAAEPPAESGNELRPAP